jgi:uncharacterized OsmC-like protein
MPQDNPIQKACAPLQEMLASNPDARLNTSQATAEIKSGLKTYFTQNDRTIIMDMPESVGGDNTGPTPGYHARAAVAGCVAIGVKMTAANAGVVFDHVRVDLEMDFDDGAGFGIGTNTAAPMETRLNIVVTTDQPREIVDELIARALEADTFYLALRDAQVVKTTVSIAT